MALSVRPLWFSPGRDVAAIAPDWATRVRTARLAMHRFTSGPPLPARVFRWQREMPAEDQRRFAAVAGGTLAELGYPV